MNRRFITLAYFLISFAIFPLVFAAPGGRQRGGGNRGGGKGAGRTPSMSRNKGGGQRKASGSQSNRRDQNRSRPSNRSGQKNRSGQIQKSNRRDQNRSRPSNRSGQKNRSRQGSTSRSKNQTNRINRPVQGNRVAGSRPYNRDRAKERKRSGRNKAKRVNQKQRGRHHRNKNWWRRDQRWGNYRYWGTAPYWGYVSSWLPYGWDSPVYYDEGNVTVQIIDYTAQDDYIDNEPIPEHPAYGDWLPLGLYVVGKTPEEAAYSNLFLQIAVNKAGEISGTYYNAGTEREETIVGVVDPVTQQAAFQLADREGSPLIVTGLYNLTQDITPVRVYFESGIEQDWFLVRMEDDQSM